MLVSAIMPTRNRHGFAADSLACFLAQDWATKELIILDDDDAPSFPNGIAAKDVHYHRQPRATIGAKRNTCCRLASGKVIIHWDDDDYSATGRITDQLNRMVHYNTPATGYHTMIFRDGEDLYRYKGSEYYALGTSLCYQRWLWERAPFNEAGFLPDGTLIPEDNIFVAQIKASLISVDAGPMMWARIHAGCTSPHKGHGSNWEKL